MEALTIALTPRGDHAIIRITGELDDSTAGQLRALDISTSAEAGCRMIVVDLGGLEFMDSSGIGALVNLRNRAAANQMAIAIDPAPAHIRHTLTVAGLAGVLGLRTAQDEVIR